MKKKIADLHCEYCSQIISTSKHYQKYCTKSCASKAAQRYPKPLGTTWNVDLSRLWIGKSIA